MEEEKRREDVLTPEQVASFLEDGLVVVPSVLTPGEVAEARQGLHATLAGHGVEHGDLERTGVALRALSTTGGAGGVIDLYYPHWKLRVAEHEKVFRAVSQVWEATYAQGDKEGWEHPHGAFDPRRGFAYLDRFGYRVPDRVSEHHGERRRRTMQRGLAPHWDCCPADLYGAPAEGRWRPVQAMVPLTDTLEPNRGGFEAVRGFHREFASFAGPSAEPGGGADPVCVGEFARVRPLEDAALLERMRHVPCRAGDLVLWDWRLPHANAAHNLGRHPREVIYTGFLPDVPCNRAFAARQAASVARCEPPGDQWQKRCPPEADEARRPLPYAHSRLGRRLLALEPWEPAAGARGAELRPARKGDLRAARAIFRACYQHLDRFKAVRKVTSRAEQRELADPDAHFRAGGGELWVAAASDDGRVLGLVGARPRPGGVLWVARLCVAREARGAGLARRLVERAEAFGRERGLARVALTTLTHLPGARALYLSMGYAEEGDGPKPIGGPLELVSLGKAL